VSGGGDDLVAATQRVLANQLHRHVRIARLGEIAEPGAANESAFALRIEPTYGFSIRNDWCEWRALFAAWSASTLSALATALLSSALTAAALSTSALIATASSVVTMFAVTLIALALAATAFATTTTTTTTAATLLLAAHGLGIVLLL
jgi:hypothetical protein